MENEKEVVHYTEDEKEVVHYTESTFKLAVGWKKGKVTDGEFAAGLAALFDKLLKGKK